MALLGRDYTAHAGHSAALSTLITAIVASADGNGFDTKFVEPVPALGANAAVAGKEHVILQFTKQ